MMARCAKLNVTGMRHIGSGRRNTGSGGSSAAARRSEARFALCVEGRDYPASLECRKVYQVLADAQAAKLGRVRVVDESGEDYLYPAEYFVPVKLPQAAERASLRKG